jgi:hypothetical protein
VEPTGEIPKTITQFDIKSYLAKYPEKISRRLKPRCVLALEAINQMLKLQMYSDEELPFVLFKNGLVINDSPRIGAFALNWEGRNDRPTIFANIGDNPMELGFNKKTIKFYRKRGWNDDRINKLCLVSFMWEEAYHFVDFKKGRLPKGIGPTGMTPGLSHDQQPHEDRAKQVKEAIFPLFYYLVEHKPKMY